MRATVVLSTLLAAGLSAQAPLYRLQPAASPGGGLDSLIVDRAGVPFLTLLDLRGGPQPILGETVWLGLTPALTLVDAGVLNAVGARTNRIPIPSSVMPGFAVFSQVVVLDGRSKNGTFRVSGGESSGIHAGKRALVWRFDDPVADGLTGDWDKAVKGRLMALAPKTRTVRSLPAEAFARFGQPIQSPLNPFGNRQQMVVRARDLGASGQEELVTAIRWRPFGGKVSSDRFQRLWIQLGHSRVVPDFTVDRISALPKFPASGLDKNYAANYAPNTGPQVVYDGRYAIDPNNLRADGYLPYPSPTKWFRYNGRDSLLIDVLVPPDRNANGVNGQEIWLTVASSPRPDARIVSAGTATNPLDPFGATAAQRGDNSAFDYQIDLTDVRSSVMSGWFDSGSASPAYRRPIVAASIPPGTSIEIDYRGARDAKGSGAGFWGVFPQQGFRFLQFRATLRASPSGARPSIDTLVVPFD